MSTGALALSSLFVLVSALVVPAWRNKHRGSEHASAVQVLSVLTLGAAVIATVWLTLQVVSLGVHDTAPQAHSRGSSLGSVLGIPVIVIPLAILIAFVGVAELLVRAERAAPTGPLAPAMATAPPPEPPSRPSGPGRFGRRKARDERALASIHGELAEGGIRSREVLADALAQIESWWSADLEQRARFEVSTHAAVEELQDSVADSTSDVTRAMQSLADACEVVNARIEAHRLERHALADAIRLLARPAPIEDPIGTPIETSSWAVAPGAEIGRADNDADLTLVDHDTEISLVDHDVEISLVDDDEPAASPTPVRVPTRRDYSAPGRGALATSVQRLRQRAQSAGWQVWTRARPRPGRNGRSF